MFERFTPDARQAVRAAQQEGRELGHHYVGTEHLLLALTRQERGIAVDVLAGAGVGPDEVRDGIVRVVGTGVRGSLLSTDDEEALAMLGIDLDLVRSRVEELFGAGSLDWPPLPPRNRRRRFRGRRHRCEPGPVGHIPFTPRSKKVLELSLREALALKHDWIGPEHILLGLIREGEGLAAELLVELGADLPDLRRQLVDRLRDVA